MTIRIKDRFSLFARFRPLGSSLMRVVSRFYYVYTNELLTANKPFPSSTGSIGLLHSLLNLPDSVAPSASSPLSQFKSTSLPLTGLERARLLETSDFFKQAHEASQGAGQSRVPVTAEERETDFHFISFVAGEWEDGCV